MKEESPDALAGAAGAETMRGKRCDPEHPTNGARRQARDPFAEARDAFIMRVITEPRATEAAVKIAVMAVWHANRIAFERNGNLTAWPSMRTIAAKLGMFRGRVARALALLEEIGLITIVRPEKRGATHHNQYIMHHVARLSDQETGDGIGLTTVANSGEKNGLIVEDNIEAEKGVIGLSGEDAMASPVGPKSIEEPPEGAGALSARPALTTDQGCSSDIEEDHLMETDAKTECGSGAVDPPLAASPDASDPDAWRSEADFNSDTRLEQNAGRAPEGALSFDRFNVDDPDTDARRELAALEAPPPASDRSIPVAMDARPFASEPDSADALIPISAADGDGADLRGQTMTMADLDRIAADEREAALILADKVSGIFPQLRDAEGFVSDLLAGFAQRQDELIAARATKTALALLMQAEGHAAAALKWRQLLSILSRAMQADQILALRNAVAAAMIEQRNRKSTTSQEAVHVEHR